MVARHGEGGGAQPFEKGPRLAELARAGAHGQVAADRHQVRRVGAQLGAKRFDDGGVGGAEMQVG